MDLIVLLDGIASHIASLFLLVVVLKFVTKRLHWKKADRYLMKLHKPAAYALVIAGAVHMLTSFHKLAEVGIFPYIAGLISLLAMVGAIYTFNMRKTNTKWLFYHRVLTIVALIACAVHPMF